MKITNFTRILAALASVLSAVLLCACNGNSSTATQSAPAGQGTTPSTPSQATLPEVTQPVALAQPGYSNQPRGNPQPKLPVLKLWVGTNEVAAEIASTLDQIRTGMMFRTNMAEMEGMLFVFPQPQQVAFYMKNTLVPLTCAYIDPDGNILEIYDMKPLDETSLPSKSQEIQYVLEMKQGWFERHGIKPGVAISTERGTFPQTFRRR
ncbi:MAG TPA: DUF192 domain-containing protein [Verrucomicrobiae bacterium]